MPKPVHVVLRRKKGRPHDGDVMSVYNDSRWEVPYDYPERPMPPHPGPHPHPEPHPGPHPGPGPHPEPHPWPGPHPGPEPEPYPGPEPEYRPTPVRDPNRLKIGMGLQLVDDTVSVKIDPSGYPGLSVGPRGLSLNDAMRKMERQERKINELAEIIVDLKSQINKLQRALSPTVIAQTLADNFDIFLLDGGELRVNVGDGLKQSNSGVISVDAGAGLRFEDDARRLSIDPETTITLDGNKFGVNIDNDTIKVNEAGQIESTPDAKWIEYKPKNQ